MDIDKYLINNKEEILKKINKFKNPKCDLFEAMCVFKIQLIATHCNIHAWEKTKMCLEGKLNPKKYVLMINKRNNEKNI
jgi:hypothetical protein